MDCPTPTKSRWKQIAQKCLSSALAASVPLYSALAGPQLTEAAEFKVTAVEDLFDDYDSWSTPSLVSNEHTESPMRFRGGLTYLNSRREAHVGGTYGLDGVIPIDDVFGVHWAGRANQFSGGTQFLTTLGAYKRSDTSGDLSDAVGAAIVADLFTDTRVSDLWLAQLRGQVGVALSDDSAIGAAFTIPLNDNHAPSINNPGVISPYTAVETIGIYATKYVDDFLLQANVGYRKSPNSPYIELTARKPIVDNKVFAYANTNYIADSGGYGIWAGIEVRLGGDSNACPGRVREVWDDPVIFNTFNYGENSFWHNTNNLPNDGFGGMPSPDGEGPPPDFEGQEGPPLDFEGQDGPPMDYDAPR